MTKQVKTEEPVRERHTTERGLKKIWIWNHYATGMFKDHGGRHYYFAKHLIAMGFEPVVFCASTMHNSSDALPVEGDYEEQLIDGIPVVLVKARSYSGNGKNRVLNMLDFYHGVQKAARELIARDGKPDVIYASSVHPLTLAAGEKVAKRHGLPCVCEIRDLWPASLVAFGYLKEKSLLARALYCFEKRIYEKADALIFTMEGGRQYICDRNWDSRSRNGKGIDLAKVFHINNGVDIADFDRNKELNPVSDSDLEDGGVFTCTYTGSIREVNRVDVLVDAAEWLAAHGEKNIKFLIYGAGNQVDPLKARVESSGLSNIVFKGRVAKECVPYVLTHSDLLLMHWGASSGLIGYGLSLNKSFEYLAAGKPIISTYGGPREYDYIESNGAGKICAYDSVEEYALCIASFSRMGEEQYKDMCHHARKTAEEQFDFRQLTLKLIETLEYAMRTRTKQ